jgi:hypothetical protein
MRIYETLLHASWPVWFCSGFVTAEQVRSAAGMQTHRPTQWNAQRWAGEPGAHGSHLGIFSLLKAIPMTFETQSPSTATPAPVMLKPEQHHSKAAEHLELAAKSHKEVAKLMGANDHTGAQTHAKVAHEHMTQAQTHAEAAKKAMPAAK